MKKTLLLSTSVVAAVGFGIHYRLEESKATGFVAQLDSVGTQQQGFERVSRDNPVTLPRDHGAHLGFRNEWWYFTANLNDDKGNQWGVQWTLFRYASSSKSDTGWDSPQRYMAHFVLSGRENQIALQRFARGGIGQAEVQSEPFEMWIDNWLWQGTDQSPFPGQLTIEEENVSAHLDIVDLGKAVPQGDQGYSQKTANGDLASHYFSHPHLAIDGNISWRGFHYQVEGQGWYDREWSSDQLVPGAELGWDWFALHLSDDEKLMVSRVRQGKSHHYIGALMTKEKTYHLQHEDIRLLPVRYHRVDGTLWPMVWGVQVDKLGIKLTVTASKAYDSLPFAIAYWEALVSFEGSHKGQGFMELTGYK
ncbi:lipocalin-like domain-containing protein [Thaumasiovibrio subtropicus]|uniref:lipocalin-like domain-containing protein n=1 Tax=Thaumasiovibrio subtropicus TaxID=1891207 RepID=UPI00131C6DFA|nr:lipocalin-like domain-containing protein [Thaumasiovibrio subtropicus]